MSHPVSERHPVVVAVGTRPEVIKLAPVVQALRQAGLPTLLLATGQHREMLDQTLEAFGLAPDRDLGVMRPDQSLAGLSAGLLAAIDPFLAEVEPSRVLVQGDTTTVLCVALGAFFRQVPTAHVEAGLRSGERYDPFPEEMNRTLVAHLADLHFAPTPRARENLLAQGVAEEAIHVVGNTVVDALRDTAARIRDRSFAELGLPDPGGRALVVVTGHRRESFGPRMEGVLTGLKRLAEELGQAALFVYPVHLNPSVREPAHRVLSGIANVHLLPPLAYAPFVKLLTAADLIVTDSGGIQEEATALGVPLLVTRATSERPEALESGTARLVGTDPERLVEAARSLLRGPRRAAPSDVFGDGRAGARIAALVAGAGPEGAP